MKLVYNAREASPRFILGELISLSNSSILTVNNVDNLFLEIHHS